MKSLIFQVFSDIKAKKYLVWPSVAVLALIIFLIIFFKSAPLSEEGAKALLGGDIEISQLGKPLPMKATSLFLFQRAELSRVFDISTEAIYNDKKTNILLKSIDNAYPLYGTLGLKDNQRKNIFTRIPHRAMHGAAVNQALLDALGIKLGQRFQVGKATLVAEALIVDEPDQKDESLPRAIVGNETLYATKLLRSGAEVVYRYRLKLPPTKQLDTFRQDIAAHFPSAKWKVMDWRDMMQ